MPVAGGGHRGCCFIVGVVVASRCCFCSTTSQLWFNELPALRDHRYLLEQSQLQTDANPAPFDALVGNHSSLATTPQNDLIKVTRRELQTGRVHKRLSDLFVWFADSFFGRSTWLSLCQ